MSDLRESLTQSGTLYGFINTIVYAHDYADLTNKPQINGVTLIGNKTASDLGLVTPATEAVQSVNGETGAVVLDGNDIDYDSTKTINQQIDAVAASIPVIPVTSVNGETGDVVLDGSNIRYDVDYTVSAKIDAVAADIPVVPVQSVNGETGNVVLDGDDISYNSSLSVNQKIDAVAAAIPVVNYPVTSVNEKTGDVVLDDTDIDHSSGVSVNSIINTITQYTPVYGNTASGSIATFDTSLALPLQNCTTEVGANKVVNVSGNVTDLATYIKGIYQGIYDFVDLGSLNWNKDTTTRSADGATIHAFYAQISGIKRIPITAIGNAIVFGYDIDSVNQVDYGGGNIVKDKIIGGGDNNSRFWIYNSVYNEYTPAQFKTAMSGVYLIYELETPTTPTITQAQLTAICASFGVLGTAYDLPLTDKPTTYVGTNNVFSDNGNTSVVYACSLKDYIDSQ